MVDLIWVAAFFAISFHNPQALIVFVGYMLAEVAFVTIDDAIYYNCVVGLICAMSGAVFIKLLSSIRNALLLSGCLYWLAAVDAFAFPLTETMYYTSFSYIVGAVDLYVLILLLGGRRLECILSGAAQYWILSWRYRILWVSHQAIQQARERIR